MKYIPREKAQQQQRNLMILEQNKVINDNQLHSFSADADMTDFNAACDQFKLVCNQIGQFTGNSDFKGGFDEAIEFVTSDAFKADQQTGTTLFALWLGCDKACTYEAKKIGIGQPKWWKICWGMQDVNNLNEQQQEN